MQYLIIYYIPTNYTNLLFIYEQHIKTFKQKFKQYKCFNVLFINK